MANPDLLAKANAGDVNAMVELGNEYSAERNFNEAIDWFDKAADAGNLNGCYFAAMAHTLRMRGLLAMQFYAGLIKDDIKGARENAGLLIKLHMDEKITLTEEQYQTMLDVFAESMYTEAAALYGDSKGEVDPQKLVDLLESLKMPKAKALCGECYFNMNKYGEAFEKLKQVAADAAYVQSDKILTEQVIFSQAMASLAAMYRIGAPGVCPCNMDKAVETWQKAIDGVQDDDLKAAGRRELARYRKTLFGNWKYE